MTRILELLTVSLELKSWRNEGERVGVWEMAVAAVVTDSIQGAVLP